jgi:hypothetical protein
MIKRSEQEGSREGRKRDARAVRLLQVFLGFVLLLDLVGAVFIPEFRSLFLSVIALFSIWIGVFFLAVVLHEVAHLVGGWLVGFRFEFLVVGRLKITRTGGRVRMGLIRGHRVPTGLAGSLPTDDRDIRRRLAVAVAAGPGASLLFAAASLVTLVAMGSDQPYALLAPDGSWLPSLLVISGTISLLLFIVTILPIQIGELLTDGARLVLLLRGGQETERYCAVGVLVGMSMAGRRGREWPAGLVEAATAVPDGSTFDTLGAMLAYGWSLDRGELAAAGGYLDRALAAAEKYPVGSRPAIYLEAAYFTARYRGDAAAARAFLKDSKGGFLVKPYSELRAEAAVLLAEGNTEAVQQRAQEGLAAIRRLGDMDIAREETDWLQELIDLSAAGQGLTEAAAEGGRLVR